MSESAAGAAAGVPGPARPGRLLADRYRLVRRIGRGGMGTVWLAEDELLGRRVAVKQLHVSHGLDEEELATLHERTRREARSAARISHPNVVVVHDVVEDEGLPCIVMEHVPSRTLGDVLKQGPVSPEEAARIGRGMIAALRAAHAADVLHRDVKPGNVLLGDDGRVVLTDFGIAHLAGNSTLTKTGEMVGSIDYIAPERVRGARPGPASDLWALGATLYEAVEGRTPYHRPTPVETAYAIAVDPLEPPLRAGPLTRLIETLLSRDPDLRPPADLVEQILREPAAEPGTVRHPTRETDGTVERSEAAAGLTPPRPLPGAEPSASVAAPEPGRTGPTAVVPSAPAPAPASGVIAVSAPAPVPGGRPVPGRRSGGRRRAGILVAAAAVLGAVTAVGAYLFLPDEKGDEAAPPKPSTAPSTPPTPSASSPPSVPPGYRLVTEKRLGVAFPVPKGWTRREKSAVEVNYIDPTGLVGLKVNVLDLASPDPLKHWQDVERQVRTEVDGYRRLRMQATAYRGDPAAVWEFAFKGRARDFRAIDLGFGRAGGAEYALYLSAPSAGWDRHRPVFDAARDGFRVLGR
ncbi:protein kinase domain-containing protein [Streptomyces sp. URMC 126]|uniref:serine/threonine-protein kinase n=1 Tax=Streptomyces sp. URMC 126 TaxID=3423401 RepID=UPI003F1DC70E